MTYDPLTDPNWGPGFRNDHHDDNPPWESANARGEQSSNGSHNRSRPVAATPASAFHPKRVRWLWDGRWAIGSLGLLGGMEGLGKSTVALDVAGAVTRGVLPGEFYGTPRSVLVCATEDSWEHTLVPRLMAARADLDRVYRIEVRSEQGVDLGLSLPVDTPGLEALATDVDAAMLMLDPLLSRLSAQLDTHKDAEVRQALEPLTGAAERTNLFVLGLIHLNKGGSGRDILDRMMASRAFTAVARSVSVVITDADDDTEATRLFGTPKNNLGRSDLPTLAFTVESVDIPTDDGPTSVGKVAWGDERMVSIRDAMANAEQDSGARTAVAEAVEWLTEYMELYGPAVDAKAVKRDARQAGHAERTLTRARSKLGFITRSKPGTFPRETQWVDE